MRVHFEYINDLSPGFTNTQFVKFRDEIMFFVKKHLETSLLVQRRKDDAPITSAQGATCGTATIPDYIATTGVADADFVLIIFTGSDSASSWVARAGVCYQDSTHFNNPMIVRNLNLIELSTVFKNDYILP